MKPIAAAAPRAAILGILAVVPLVLGPPVLGGCQLFSGNVSLSDSVRGKTFHREAVVFVPGILGSILADAKTGSVEWVTATQALLPLGKPDLSLPIAGEIASRPAAPGLVSVGVLESIPVVPGLYADPIYRPLVQAFLSMGYKVGNCDFPRADEDFFLFGYDFRRDGVEVARRLALAIERIRDTRADPNEKIAIVAHSFGGLVVRYYLMYGDRDALKPDAAPPDGAGADGVSRVVFLGTPHHGAIGLLKFILDGYGYFYTGTLIGTDAVLSMPSTYQVFCEPAEDCFLDGTDRAKGLRPFRDAAGQRLNLYDPQSWVWLGWLPDAWREGARRRFFEESLHRGLLWWTALERPWAPPACLAMLNVGSTSHPTPGRAVLTHASDRWNLRFSLPWYSKNANEETLDLRIVTAGDGRVTLDSAFDYPNAERVVSTAEHDFVHHDPAVLANILLFILGDRILPPREGHAGSP